jgi:hypothetical protein
MNYLGLVGLLGLTGRRRAAGAGGGQIADLGGGALMAAFGIMAALQSATVRRGGRSGRDGWWTCRWRRLAGVAGDGGGGYFADGTRGGDLPLAGR